jgi:glycosyltransferase involved in cell wall biosynthesis
MKTNAEPDQLDVSSKKPSLIVQVAPCHVSLERETGGVANIVRQICLKLANSHRQTLLLCSNTELGRVVAEPGFRRVSEYLSVCVLPQRRSPLFGPTIALRQQIHTLPPHAILHVHTCFSGFTETAMRCASGLRIPYIFTPHGKLSREFLARKRSIKLLWWKLIAKACVTSATEIALSSARESDLFSELGISNRFKVIPNGFEIPNSPLGPPFTSEIGLPYVLFLGYLDPRKQPEFLVRVFAESKLPQTHALVIAGPDSYGHGHKIKAAVVAAGLQNRVVFTGPVYGHQKWTLLRNAACLCLPSRAEGLPVVLCEALGAGLPVLLSSECNFRELAQHGAGIELTGFNTTVWKNALESICLSNENRSAMSAAALALSTRYSWDKIVVAWTTLYDTALRQNLAPKATK